MTCYSRVGLYVTLQQCGSLCDVLQQGGPVCAMLQKGGSVCDVLQQAFTKNKWKM